MMMQVFPFFKSACLLPSNFLIWPFYKRSSGHSISKLVYPCYTWCKLNTYSWTFPFELSQTKLIEKVENLWTDVYFFKSCPFCHYSNIPCVFNESKMKSKDEIVHLHCWLCFTQVFTTNFHELSKIFSIWHRDSCDTCCSPLPEHL